MVRKATQSIGSGASLTLALMIVSSGGRSIGPSEPWSLTLNFIFWPNINYRQITALRHISFLGEPVSVASGVPNPWMIGQFVGRP